MYGKENVIYAIDYAVTATNTNTNQSKKITFRMGIPYSEVSFKEFDNLTEAEAILWIEEFLSPDEIEKYKAMARGDIVKTSYKKLLG